MRKYMGGAFMSNAGRTNRPVTDAEAKEAASLLGGSVVHFPQYYKEVAGLQVCDETTERFYALFDRLLADRDGAMRTINTLVERLELAHRSILAELDPEENWIMQDSEADLAEARALIEHVKEQP